MKNFSVRSRSRPCCPKPEPIPFGQIQLRHFTWFFYSNSFQAINYLSLSSSVMVDESFSRMEALNKYFCLIYKKLRRSILQYSIT